MVTHLISVLLGVALWYLASGKGKRWARRTAAVFAVISVVLAALALTLIGGFTALSLIASALPFSIAATGDNPYWKMLLFLAAIGLGTADAIWWLESGGFVTQTVGVSKDAISTAQFTRTTDQSFDFAVVIALCMLALLMLALGPRRRRACASV